MTSLMRYQLRISHTFMLSSLRIVQTVKMPGKTVLRIVIGDLLKQPRS